MSHLNKNTIKKFFFFLITIKINFMEKLLYNELNKNFYWLNQTISLNQLFKKNLKFIKNFFIK